MSAAGKGGRFDLAPPGCYNKELGQLPDDNAVMQRDWGLSGQCTFLRVSSLVLEAASSLCLCNVRACREQSTANTGMAGLVKDTGR